MDRSREISEFLRSRRNRLTPDEVDIPARPGSRRVMGLRRDEIALLAGISTDYYTRIEQGRARNVSDQVLGGVARALRLDPLENAHLRVLLGADPVLRRELLAVATRARASTKSMIDAFGPVPALAHNLMLDVLASNRMVGALFPGLTPGTRGRGNLARWVFTDPRARHVFVEWEETARAMAATLRSAAGVYGAEPSLHRLVEELSAASADFRAFWATHQLSAPGSFAKTLHHELTGPFTVTYQSLKLPQESDQYVAIYVAAPGSAAADKLHTIFDSTTPRVGRAR